MAGSIDIDRPDDTEVMLHQKDLARDERLYSLRMKTMWNSIFEQEINFAKTKKDLIRIFNGYTNGKDSENNKFLNISKTKKVVREKFKVAKAKGYWDQEVAKAFGNMLKAVIKSQKGGRRRKKKTRKKRKTRRKKRRKRKKKSRRKR